MKESVFEKESPILLILSHFISYLSERYEREVSIHEQTIRPTHSFFAS